MLHTIGAILKALYYENNKSPVYFVDLLYKNWMDNHPIGVIIIQIP